MLVSINRPPPLTEEKINGQGSAEKQSREEETETDEGKTGRRRIAVFCPAAEACDHFFSGQETIANAVGWSEERSYPFSPGGRYAIDEAFFRAASVSSTVSNAVVWNELNAPPAPIASAVAAIETLSGASQRQYPS